MKKLRRFLAMIAFVLAVSLCVSSKRESFPIFAATAR